MINDRMVSMLNCISSGMIDCQCISSEDFNVLNTVEFKEISREDLEVYVSKLFEEHMRLTKLLITVSELANSVRNYPCLFN